MKKALKPPPKAKKPHVKFDNNPPKPPQKPEISAKPNLKGQMGTPPPPPPKPSKTAVAAEETYADAETYYST